MLERKSSSWFYPKRTNDVGRDRNAHTLQIACFLGAFAISVIVVLNVIAGDPGETPLLAFAVAGLVASAVINRAGRWDWAARIAILAVLFATILLVVEARDGFRSHAMLLFPGLLFISVMLLDRASYVVTAGIVLLAVTALGIAEMHGFVGFTPPLRTPTSYASILNVDLNLLAIAIIGSLIARDTQRNVFDLRRSELKYRRLYESITDAVVAVDMAGHIVESNPVYDAMLGYTAEELRLFTYQDLTPARWHALEAQIIAEQLLATGKTEVYEKEYRRRDGTIFPIELRTYLIRDEENQPTGMWAIVRDITERKRAEQVLRNSEERYRTIVQMAMDGLCVVDTQGRLLEVNESYCRMSGYCAEELLAMRVSDLDAEETASDVAKRTQKIMEQGEDRFEARHRRKDGSIFEVEISIQYQPIDGGRFVVFLRDITERKQAEDALRTSEERFRALADSALVGIYILQNGKYTYVNPAMARVFGYTVAEMTGMVPHDIVHPSHHAMVEENIRRRIAGQVHYMHYEVRGRYRDGSIRNVEVYGSTVQLNGRPALVGTLLDITDRRRAEEERERLQQQLTQAQKMECVGRLAGGIAHDFNNLMSAILMYADSSLDGISTADSATECVKAIRDAAEKAAALGQQLMVFSSRQMLQTEVLNLNSVIADSQKLVRRLIGEDVNVVFKPGSGLCLVRSDRGQLGQIIMNLAVNSRDAMPEGGTFTIETDRLKIDESYARLNPEAKPGEYVTLVVRDTGMGMDKDTQARLFEPFFTTKGIGKGTGLGLSVVYGIVKQSGGFITVTSEPGQGAEFRIYVPAVQEMPKPVLDTDEGPVLGGSETILLVEDEAALRQKVHEVLENEGYQVLVAGDGEQALQLALREARVIHLLLTDVVMPELSGPRLAERLLTVRPGTKVLYMSGYPNAGDETFDLQSQPNFIQKPFSRKKLLRRVRDVLDANTPEG